ncbi:MAG TPA: S-layer homology domain-containing protein [Negativicutes bacterium]|nr:S-layer homology domain-containing protein [Negativicutes bacterium]
MKRKLSAILVALVMILGLLSQAITAAPLPQTVSAPENFGVANYGGAAVHCTLSAPDDLRALIDMTEKERGYFMGIWAQIDFKTDNGNWHYSSDWDGTDTYKKYALAYYNALIGGDFKQYLGHGRLVFKTAFPEETNVPVPAAFNSWDWYKSHSITYRARFAIDFGNKTVVFSSWTPEYVLSGSSKMDYKTIMNTYGPTLTASKLEENPLNKRPYVILSLGRHPVEIQKFNAASTNSMRTEVWLRKSGDKDFKLISDAPFSNEVIKLDLSSYYGNNVPNYAAAAYDVKIRYKIDERAYQQSGLTGLNWLYSPYSNTLSYGMPAWTGASAWATAELQKANDMGLIPDILKGADMTKNITREEFAELALLMYQKASGKTDTTPFSPNPFTDLQNPQVLKAYKLGIVKGMSPTTFEPKKLINREQVAVMLVRTIKLIAPDADYSNTGAPTFADQGDISGWALNDCLYISKLGIIKGSDGKFMPRAVTKAQTAAGYANTSREQAIAMSVRSVEKMRAINP